MMGNRPSARRATGAAAFRGAFYVFGGFGIGGTVRPDDVGDDLWCWDGTWDRVATGGPPAARYSSLIGADGALFLFGGCGVADGHLDFHSQLWRFDDRWDHVRPIGKEAPSGRYTAALASYDNALFVFGGHAQDQSGTKSYFNDLWRFDLTESRWYRHGPGDHGPGRRYGFGWTVHGQTLHLFGGFDGHRDRGDLWSLDLETLRWELRAPEGGEVGPAPRYCPALGVVNKQLVLFGGRSKTRPKLNFSDCWVFDGAWSSWNGSGPGYHAKPAYASDGSTLWMFGGEGPHGHLGDLWQFDRNGWTMRHESPERAPVLW